MKARFYVFFLLALALFLLPSPTRAEAGIFRDFVWGVSPEDVKKFETATLYKDNGDSLVFLEQPDAFRRLITYDFADGKLWRARYEYVELHDPNAQRIVELYGDEERKLEAKFGKPASEEFLWQDKTYLKFPQFWGRALLARNLRFRARWQTADTDVELQTYKGTAYFETFYTMQKRVGQNPDQPVDIFNSPQKLR